MTQRDKDKESIQTVSYDTIRHLLEQCIAKTIAQVQREVIDPLPHQIELSLNANELAGQYTSLDVIMPYLYRDGSFPQIVDIAIKGIKDEKLLVWLNISNHPFVHNFTLTWNTPPGMGPFKSIGLMLPPSIWSRPRPLYRQDLEEAGRKKINNSE